MQIQRCLILLALSATLSPSLLRAEILAYFDFEAESALEEFTQSMGFGFSADTNSNTNAGFYNTRGGGFTSSDTGITPNIDSFKNHAFTFSTNTGAAGNSQANNFYHDFRVEILNGSYTLDGLSFEYWINNTINTTDFSVSVYSDLTGFETGAELARYDYIQQPNAPLIQEVVIEDLDENAVLQGLTAGDAVEFRLVFEDSFPAGFVHRIDEVQLTASNLQLVPEPSAVSVLGVVGILGLVRRRRRS